MPDYPSVLVPAGHVEPVPRRVRGYLDGLAVFDTTSARYVWEIPNYPQFYIPLADVTDGVLVDEQHVQQTRRGPVHLHGVRVGDAYRSGAARVLRDSDVTELTDTVHFEWSALDAWFEEDERVFVHPRSPYVRVDALRSTRHLRVELDGVLLAESSSPVLLFETGLPTRYYVDQTALNPRHMAPAGTTQTACPYKGVTSRYWTAHVDGVEHADIAWEYDFPLEAVAPIRGLVAFYNERVDLIVDGVRIERPQTRFTR